MRLFLPLRPEDDGDTLIAAFERRQERLTGLGASVCSLHELPWVAFFAVRMPRLDWLALTGDFDLSFDADEELDDEELPCLSFPQVGPAAAGLPSTANPLWWPTWPKRQKHTHIPPHPAPTSDRTPRTRPAHRLQWLPRLAPRLLDLSLKRLDRLPAGIRQLTALTKLAAR